MVDLKTAIHELNTGKIEFVYKDDDCCTTEGEVVILLKRLEELEKADVMEVKYGYWIVDGDITECSNCHKEYVTARGMLQLKEFEHCPNCGAKMDKEGNTE